MNKINKTMFVFMLSKKQQQAIRDRLLKVVGMTKEGLRNMLDGRICDMEEVISFEEVKKLCTEYTKVYTAENGMSFRYNKTESLLECITFENCSFDDESEEIKIIDLEEPEVVTSQGLSYSNWLDNPQYWVDCYADELEEECQDIEEFA